MREISARFTKPMLPGNTLRTKIWKKRGNVVLFQAYMVGEDGTELKVLDLGKVVIGNPIQSRI